MVCELCVDCFYGESWVCNFKLVLSSRQSKTFPEVSFVVRGVELRPGELARRHTAHASRPCTHTHTWTEERARLYVCMCTRGVLLKNTKFAPSATSCVILASKLF